MNTPADKATLTTTDSDEAFAGVIPRRWARGLGWLLVAVVGAFALHMLAGMTEYGFRWLGAVLKAASGAWGGFRISRDICRIDPSVTTDPIASAILQFARAFIVAVTILAVCIAV